MPTTRTFYSCLFMVVLIPLSHMAGARTVYKWIDEQGQAHYGEQAPELAGGVTPLQIEDAPRARPRPAPLRFSYTPTRSRPRKDPSGSTRKNAAQRAARRCARYRNKLAYYRARMRAGYKARQYNTLEDKRRHYRRQLHRECP
jgi:hypothetical protein